MLSSPAKLDVSYSVGSAYFVNLDPDTYSRSRVPEQRRVTRWSSVNERSSVAATLALCAWLCASPSLLAHDISRSESTLEVQGRQVDATLTLNLLDFHKLPDIDRNHDGVVSYDELDEAIEPLYAAVRQHYIVRAADVAVQTTLERYALVGQNVLRLDITYRFAADVRSVTIESTLDQISQPDHRHLTSATVGGSVQEAVLDAATPTVVFETGRGAYLRTALSFGRLGIERMFTGYDHLAFLLGLLIATATIRSLIKIVACFTIAHSITLALATFDAVVLPARLTESLIALSIGYVAVENLLPTPPVARYRMTFLFGLFHGFGLSAVLRNMPLPRQSVALSLFSFNAGVEIGQVIFVAALFPLTLYVASTRWKNQILPAVSSGAVCLAMYWFVQRAFLN